MNILCIEYEPSSKRGGQEKSYLDIIEGLVKNDCQVTLFYVKKGDLLFKYHNLGVKSIQIKAINIIKKSSATEWYNFIYSFLKILFTDRFDSIYVNQIMDIPLACLVKFFQKKGKLVCHLRLPPLGYDLKAKNNQLGILIKFVDQFITANNNMKKEHIISGIPSHKISVIFNGFWFDRFTFHLQKSVSHPLKIIYIGRISEEKGIHEAIEGLSLYQEHFVFDIAGVCMNDQHEIYKNLLLNLAKEKKIKNNIRFIGHVADPVSHISHYDICIFPSIWNEPFGRVLVESIVAGVPVIAKNVGAIREILNDPKGEWTYENYSEIADLLHKFVKNPYAYAISDRQKYIRSKYDLNKISKEIAEVMS